MQTVVIMYSKSAIVNELPFERRSLVVVRMCRLGETKVLATGGHGGVEGLAKILVSLVLRQIELYRTVSISSVIGTDNDLRLKQV